MSDDRDATRHGRRERWSWEPVIVDGYIRDIDERCARGGIRVLRLYSFDSTATLRHYREWKGRGDSTAPWPVVSAADIDSAVMADAPVEAMTVEFLAGVPMYSVRRVGRSSTPLRGVETRAIVARAHTLYSRATQSTASR